MVGVTKQRIFSRPSTTLPRLIEIYRDIINLEDIGIPHKGKTRDKFVFSSELSKDNTIVGFMEAYKSYEELLFSNLNKYNGAKLIIFNGMSPDRSMGKPSRIGADLFHPMYYLTDGAWLSTISKLLAENNPHDLLGDHILMSGQITDWPATTIQYEGKVGIKHPFSNEVSRLEKTLIGKSGQQKEGYGSLERFFNDSRALQGNSQYSEGVLDFSVFKAIRESNPLLDRDLILEAGDRQKFYDDERIAIQIIKKIVLEKNKRFLEELKPNSLHIYAMKGSSTMELWSSAAELAGVTWKPVGGIGGLLHGADNKGNAELNQIAIGRLEGMISTWYNQQSSTKIIPKFENSNTKNSYVEQFRACPWNSTMLCNKVVGCDGPSQILASLESCLTTDMNSLNDDQKKLVTEFGLINGTGILPIEGFYHLLNNNDNALGFDNKKWRSWVLDLGEGKLVPFKINSAPHLSQDEYSFRISDLTYPTKLEDFITKTSEQINLEKEKSLAEIPEALERGTLWHRLIFEGTQSKYKNLIHPDFQMPRYEYCDSGDDDPNRKHLVYEFRPNSKHFEKVRENVYALFRKRNISIPNEKIENFLDFLDDIEGIKPKIKLFGHPDSVGEIYFSGVEEINRPIVIIDGKTSIPSKNVLYQEIAYGNAIKQMHGKTDESMYAITLHPRFTPNRFLPEEQRDMTDYGLHLQMVPSMEKVYFRDKRDFQFHALALQLYAGKKFTGMI
jgi:hypothetical protein